MYRAIGDSSAWRDGVFSHAAPGQSYQASRQEYAGGSLGAVARAVANARMQQRNHSTYGRRPLKGPAFQDGSLGDYGRAFRSGSLGADTTTAATAPSTINLPNQTTITVGPDGASIAPTAVPAVVPFYKTPAFMVGAAGATVVVLYLALRK